MGIARALANAPRLLIPAEPTGQLDSVSAETMMALIASLVHDRGWPRHAAAVPALIRVPPISTAVSAHPKAPTAACPQTL